VPLIDFCGCPCMLTWMTRRPEHWLFLLAVKYRVQWLRFQCDKLWLIVQDMKYMKYCIILDTGILYKPQLLCMMRRGEREREDRHAASSSWRLKQAYLCMMRQQWRERMCACVWVCVCVSERERELEHCILLLTSNTSPSFCVCGDEKEKESEGERIVHTI